MRPADWSTTTAFTWTQPRMTERRFELSDGSKLVGMIEFPNWYGSRATGYVFGAAWTLKRSGFFRTRASARLDGSDNDLFVFELSGLGNKGTIQLASGEQLLLKSTGLMATTWILRSANDTELLQYKLSGILHQGAAVTVSAAGLRRPDLPLLLVGVMYVLVLLMADAAAG